MKFRSVVAWFGLPVFVLAVAACAILTGQTPAKPVKYRLSPAQVEAIQKAGPGAKVVLWEGAAPAGLKYTTTLWQSVNGGTPQDEAHPCPPFDDC